MKLSAVPPTTAAVIEAAKAAGLTGVQIGMVLETGETVISRYANGKAEASYERIATLINYIAMRKPGRPPRKPSIESPAQSV